MNTLFIAVCRVSVTPYMNNSSYYTTTHLVEAEDLLKAERKIKDFYKKKEDPYAVYYGVDIEDIQEIIR